MRTRLESDQVGQLEIPSDAYYGIHTLRAVENFPITGRKLPDSLIESIAEVKKACAMANKEAGDLCSEKANAIIQACDEILNGQLREYFIVDPIQGGAGTSTNMNANEVIANRAIEILGGQKGCYSLVNPNDHVNLSQSTNDVYPSCIKMSLYKTSSILLHQITRLINAFEQKARTFDHIIKMGRTQLQDAVPVRLGQEFQAYANALRREHKRVTQAQNSLLLLNLGGTAIGTGINASYHFIKTVVPKLAAISGIPFVQSEDLIDATQNLDCFVHLSGALKNCGVTLSKICNDLRLMSSGPRDGLGEITLPPRQNGSSIMPGKINPVIPEVVNQIAFRLIGFDTTIALAVEAGQLELNAFEPVIYDSLYQGICQLSQGIATLVDHCVLGIEANEENCHQEIQRSVGLATALCPYIGYSKSCQIAKEALKSGISVRQLVLRDHLIPEEELEQILDPLPMTDWTINKQRYN